MPITLIMTEQFLQYIWQHQLFEKENMLSVQKEKVEIITPGVYNTNAGPDFLNARIKLNDTIWAGNIEIHTDSALWQTHGHHRNKAYNNVILHVVLNYSIPATTTDNREIPTIELKIDETLVRNYQSLVFSESSIPCSEGLHLADSFIWKMWLDRLCIERLESKTDQIKGLLDQNKGNWEESFYIILAKSFGFKTNALPFEMLARLTPLKVISKYSNNLTQLEALLFGQAGFLNEMPEDQYTESLKKEYQYLKKVHNLKPVEKHLWKFLRLRPSNFPTIRIAQFAGLIHRSSRLFSKILEAENINTLHNLLKCHVSEYWNTHYTFGTTSKLQKKNLGKLAINGLLINTIVPFMFIYGKDRGMEEVSSRAIDFLELLPPEKNTIVSQWNNHNVIAKNAAQSQALIELLNIYCNEKNCLYCQVGNTIIQHRNKQ
jgi:hypothetical protein